MDALPLWFVEGLSKASRDGTIRPEHLTLFLKYPDRLFVEPDFAEKMIGLLPADIRTTDVRGFILIGDKEVLYQVARNVDGALQYQLWLNDIPATEFCERISWFCWAEVEDVPLYVKVSDGKSIVKLGSQIIDERDRITQTVIVDHRLAFVAPSGVNSCEVTWVGRMRSMSFKEATIIPSNGKDLIIKAFDGTDWIIYNGVTEIARAAKIGRVAADASTIAYVDETPGHSPHIIKITDRAGCILTHLIGSDITCADLVVSNGAVLDVCKFDHGFGGFVRWDKGMVNLGSRSQVSDLSWVGERPLFVERFDNRAHVRWGTEIVGNKTYDEVFSLHVADNRIVFGARKKRKLCRVSQKIS